MLNKVVIVTGANSGIGKQSAIAFCGMGAHVVMACRNSKYGKEQHVSEVIDEIKATQPDAKLTFIPIDLASLSSIRAFVCEFQDKFDCLDVLLNNAGLVSLDKLETADGFELTMGTNHLGPFLLTNLLLNKLKNTPDSRIVNVSSKTHAKGKLTFTNDNFRARRPYVGLAAYADSKLANIYFTQELAERLVGTDTTANCLHPGGIASNIWPDSKGIVGMIRRRIVKNLKTPEQGAAPSIYVCSSPDLNGVTGKYFYKKKQIRPHKRAQNRDIQKKLWQISAVLTGLDVS